MACTQLRPSPHGKRPGVNRQIQLFPNEHPLVSHQATAAAAAAGGELFMFIFFLFFAFSTFKKGTTGHTNRDAFTAHKG